MLDVMIAFGQGLLLNYNICGELDCGDLGEKYLGYEINFWVAPAKSAAV